MPLKKVAARPASRKAQAKKANAAMKNAPEEKILRTRARAEASRAARSMAKTVDPAVRKSAAKRVEKDEARAARVALAMRLEQDGLDACKQEVNRIAALLKNECAAVADGKIGEKHFRELILAVSRAIALTREKQGYAAPEG